MMKKILSLVFLVVLQSGYTWTVAAEEATRPNIVLIISDDQGYGDYGFMQHPVIKTPTIDRLADQSLLFTRGYVTTALCCPSLATMLTGLYPHQHGYSGNDPQRGIAREQWVEHFRKLPQLPALLQEAGYLSLHTGKYWQGDPSVSGFTDSMGATGRHGGKALSIGRSTMQPVYDFIAKAEDQKKPFFLWYAPFLPHTPHNPPERLLAKYRDKTPDPKRAKYFAMCEWLDETCGQLLSHLDEQGIADNTMVIYIADNGWSQGVEGFRGSKQTLWEQGVRQPVMIRWPGRVEPLRDEQRLVSNIDLAPTILAAAGLPVPKSMEGVNLLDDEAVSARKAIFLEDFAHNMAAPDKPEKTLEGRGVVAGDWKLVETYVGKKEQFLFDLKNDPKEEKNMATENGAKANALIKLLNEWWEPEGVQVQPAKESRAKKRPARTFASMQKALEPSRVVTYKTIGDRELTLHIFQPKGFKPTDSRSAYVLFHGGGWRSGTPRRFYPYAASLVPKGFVGISVEYRLTGRSTTVFDCVRDGRAAIRYIRRHAAELGIDPTRIAVGGGSAGGHVALGTALFDTEEHPDEDRSVSCRPDALVLMFAVLDTSKEGYGNDRIGEGWQRISPLHQIRSGMPPTLVFHGDQDSVAPYSILAAFCTKMEESGNTCKLVLEKGGKHGHLNNNMTLFDSAAKSTAIFLESSFDAN